MTKHAFSLTAALLGLSVGAAAAMDWPQYRGPNHDGTSPEKIRTSWGELRTVWKTPMHDGFSAITVADGKAFTLVTAEVEGTDQEVCAALDAASGKPLWTAPLGIARYGRRRRPRHGRTTAAGTRSTPSFDGGKVYAYSARIVLKCLDAASGKEVWAHDIMKEHAGKDIHWQSAASPLIDDGLVFVAGGGAGQALLAFDKNDGRLVWKGQDDRQTQSTPVAATILGERQIIFFTQTGLVAVAPKTGAVLWRYPFPYRVSTAISPVVSGDIVYCSAAYGVGSSACRIVKQEGKYAAQRLWMQPGNKVANHWSTPVCKDGFIYGIFDQANFGDAPLGCVELATGKAQWSQPGFGMGGCTLVDGCIMTLTEGGDLVLVKATPAAYSEVARAHVLSGKCWNSPSVSNGRIYARSTKEGVSLDVAQ